MKKISASRAYWDYCLFRKILTKIVVANIRYAKTAAELAVTLYESNREGALFELQIHGQFKRAADLKKFKMLAIKKYLKEKNYQPVEKSIG